MTAAVIDNVSPRQTARDHDNGEIVFDSNAILLYLADKTGRFGATDAPRGELLSWLMLIATGLSPFSGQAVHFTHFHTDNVYATSRYRREVERHYGVLDERLAGRDYIVGGSYSIVDMAAWGWIDRAPFVLNRESPLADWPNLERWSERVNARAAVARARQVGTDIDFKKELDDEARRAMFPHRDARPGGA